MRVRRGNRKVCSEAKKKIGVELYRAG